MQRAVLRRSFGHEWAGVFSLEEGSYEWTAQKVGGEYADPAMRMVVLRASGVTRDALDSVEGLGEALIKRRNVSTFKVAA